MDEECVALLGLLRKANHGDSDLLGQAGSPHQATAAVSHMICPAGVLLDKGTQTETQLLNVTSIKVPRKEKLQAPARCLNRKHVTQTARETWEKAASTPSSAAVHVSKEGQDGQAGTQQLRLPNNAGNCLRVNRVASK